MTKRKETTTTPKVGENEVVENEVVKNDDVVCSCNSRVLSVNVYLLPMWTTLLVTTAVSYL